MSDDINHPPHYKAANGMEAIDVIEAFGLDKSFARGNAAKYLLRAGKKGPALKDLKKTAWYVNREIKSLEATGQSAQPALFYLATPYTKFQGGDLTAAFLAACRLTADLIVSGMAIYSPIVHCHPVAMNSGLDPLDHELWLKLDGHMMEATDGLIVAQMEGWRDSYGVNHEIEFFTAEKKPIFYLDCESLALASLPFSEKTIDLSKPLVDVEHHGTVS